MPPPRHYTYRGDRLTDPALKGAPCSAVLRPDGTCICGGSKMLVLFHVEHETRPRVVLRRLLRKIPNPL